MAKKQDTPDLTALSDKMQGLGYADFETRPGEEKILMLYVQDHLISSVEYAMSLSDDALKALIDETVGAQ